LFAGVVGLRVEGGRHFEFNTGELVEGFPERRDKKLVAVRDDFEGESILAVPVFKE
jgi:hypothetical protein